MLYKHLSPILSESIDGAYLHVASKWHSAFGRMAPRGVVLLLLASLVLGFASAQIRGIDPTKAEKYSQSSGSFTCLDGSKTIPFDRVNDNYCDCPGDGSDEPGTPWFLTHLLEPRAMLSIPSSHNLIFVQALLLATMALSGAATGALSLKQSRRLLLMTVFAVRVSCIFCACR